MAAQPPAQPSQLDHLLAEGYLDGLDKRSLDDIRAMRSECEETEVGLSYIRRLAQGRLDIVYRALDTAGSTDDGEGDDERADQLATLVEDMPKILSGGHHRPAGPGRLPMLMAPDTELPELTAELDAVLDVVALGTLEAMGEDELRDVATRLEAIEHRVSGQRHELHIRIDALQAEIVSRYKTGQASVDGLLS